MVGVALFPCPTKPSDFLTVGLAGEFAVDRLFAIIDRLFCRHNWLKVAEYDIVRAKGTVARHTKTVVGQRVDYQCSKCKSRKTVRTSWNSPPLS